MTPLSWLESLDWLRDSPAGVREAIAAAARPLTLQAGDVFYREAEPCAHFAVIETGDLRVFRTDAQGRELTLYHVRDGGACVVNLLCVTLDRPAMATARAEAVTSVIVFPGAMLDPWMAASGAVRRFVLEAFADRVVEVMSLAQDIAFHPVVSRLAALLLERFAQGGAVLATHDEIAAELGTAREVVSRALGDLAKRGAIRARRGRIVLLDEDSLRQVK